MTTHNLYLPESVVIQIIETSGGTSIGRGNGLVLAEVELPLCEAGKTLSSVPMEPITFKGDTSVGSVSVGGGNYLRISHDHAGLGANVEFAANPDGR